MGHDTDDRYEEHKKELEKNERSSQALGDLSVIEILKRIQQQMTFLERKVDNLTTMLENRSEKEHHPKYHDEGRHDHHDSRDRKFSHGYSKDNDSQSGKYYKENDSSSGKPFGKPFGKPYGKPFGKSSGKPFGKSSGKPFGKSSGKSFGKPFGDKKKVFSSKGK